MTRARLIVMTFCAAAASSIAAQPVDPQMQQVVAHLKPAGVKPIHTMTPKPARNAPSFKDAVEATARDEHKPTTREPVMRVMDRSIAGPGGPIAIRIYTPSSGTAMPGLVYFHGGGFVVADLDTYDASCRALANAAQAVIVSVHYRQAPEHPFPASHDDAQVAFRYVADHPSEFNVDPLRLAVGGESAGGNLATVVAMRQKRDGGKMPVFQLLVYPFISNDVDTPSHRRNGQGNFILGNQDIVWFWRHEFGPDWAKVRDPFALPIYASKNQLRGLPPAIVIAGSLDPLLDESRTYAQKLKDAGVAVEIREFDGVTHEFFGMGNVVDKAKQAEQNAADALKRAFGGVKR